MKLLKSLDRAFYLQVVVPISEFIALQLPDVLFVSHLYV